MKRITAFMVALFLVLGIAATNGFAQDNMMKQQDTMKRQTDTMMSSKKPVMKKRRSARKHRKTYRHRRPGKTTVKKSTM